MRAKEVPLSPHPVTACTGHHLADQAVIYAEAHMYLDGLLWNEMCGPIGLDTLGVFSLLELSALSNSRSGVAVLVPPLVAALAPAALEAVLAPSIEGRSL